MTIANRYYEFHEQFCNFSLRVKFDLHAKKSEKEEFSTSGGRTDRKEVDLNMIPVVLHLTSDANTETSVCQNETSELTGQWTLTG